MTANLAARHRCCKLSSVRRCCFRGCCCCCCWPAGGCAPLPSAAAPPAAAARGCRRHGCRRLPHGCAAGRLQTRVPAIDSCCLLLAARPGAGRHWRHCAAASAAAAQVLGRARAGLLAALAVTACMGAAAGRLGRSGAARRGPVGEGAGRACREVCWAACRWRDWQRGSQCAGWRPCMGAWRGVAASADVEGHADGLSLAPLLGTLTRPCIASQVASLLRQPLSSSAAASEPCKRALWLPSATTWTCNRQCRSSRHPWHAGKGPGQALRWEPPVTHTCAALSPTPLAPACRRLQRPLASRAPGGVARLAGRGRRRRSACGGGGAGGAACVRALWAGCHACIAAEPTMMQP